MIGLGVGLKASEELNGKLEALKWFKVNGPQGGYSNDGFELNCNFFFDADEKQLAFMDMLAIEYTQTGIVLEPAEKELLLHNPPFKLRIDEENDWVGCPCFQWVLGFNAYVQTGYGYLSLQLNQSDCSRVTFNDVCAALEIENKLMTRPEILALCAENPLRTSA